MTSSQESHFFGENVLLIVRSLLFLTGMIFSVIIWGPIIVLASFLSFERRYRIAQKWSRFIIWWLNRTCKVEHRISGLEHIPPGPAIIVAKHQSAWETVFLQQFMPPRAWVVKRELLWIPLFGWALATLNPIAINRKTPTSALKQILRQGKICLAQRRWVLIFPEGTRTAPGYRRPYGASGALLAVNSGCPILPIAHNAGEYWPRRGFLKRPGTVQLVFGPPIISTGRKAKELNAFVENWIETTMTRISNSAVQPGKTNSKKTV
jgi:1-acyl-sn-glycerol-3-phosphate acyltransferase